MAKPLKEKGLEEIGSFRKRVLRQYGMNRISGEDYKELSDAVDTIMNILSTLEERDDQEGDLENGQT